jgi:chorismate mutase
MTDNTDEPIVESTDEMTAEHADAVHRLLTDGGEPNGVLPSEAKQGSGDERSESPGVRRSSSELRSDGGEEDGMQDMSLDELREEIESIDRELVELIARRTYVADTIAAVKDDRDLPTTDEQQEQRVMDRAGRNAEQFDVDANLVKAIFRLLIELNKVEQRESR